VVHSRLGTAASLATTRPRRHHGTSPVTPRTRAANLPGRAIAQPCVGDAPRCDRPIINPVYPKDHPHIPDERALAHRGMSALFAAKSGRSQGHRPADREWSPKAPRCASPWQCRGQPRRDTLRWGAREPRKEPPSAARSG
jgi:hypothetical protein